ncbi:RMD1 family protein [Aestuariivivens sediminicola]|uniref:RMD1 family protein n=1 Tax=Aestuariivivens sediminicola TaxID=2913560 RepID=UPI001F595E7A|nr:RMD1 family protein [Aestuariivivens sediminicola]
MKVEFDKVILPDLDQEMIRLVMLNTSQSVALERYSEITEDLLIETNKHTVYLEKHGKLDISGNKLKRFIGKILNIKNKISENLYIFDSPEVAWENKELNKLNQDLKQSFDLKDRYRLIHDRIEIIKENLELFKDIMDQRESSLLEWTIIILIVIEVIDLLISKIL